jgi:aspartate kinase
VDVVTTSEVSVSVTIDDRRQLPAIRQALSAFAEVVVEDGMALIGVVGDNLPADPMTFARIVMALGRTPLKLVSQAASRRNVTVVLPEAYLPAAVAALHQEFFGDAVPVAVAAEGTAGESRMEGTRS